MRSITIVGAGQAGLQLGISLRKQNHDVRIVTSRTAEEVAAGRVLSSQCMQDSALQFERDLGICFWERECPPIEGIGLALAAEDGSTKALDWAYRLNAPAQSVDQRLKFPAWMRHFQKIGGDLIIADAGIDDLERYHREGELVIVAAGKGDIGRLFRRDDEKSTHDRSARVITILYVTGMTPTPDFTRVSGSIVPGVGEYFAFPALTAAGPCSIMNFACVPGGPMDRWNDLHSPSDYVTRGVALLRQFVSWEAERCQNVTLTDPNGVLSGALTPVVRDPVGRLPSGALVLGMADTVVLNDPIAGQGANSAAKCARNYAQSISVAGQNPFDEAWMRQTFRAYWYEAQWATAFTNTFLAPPPPHVGELLGAAQTSARVGRALVNGFNDPGSIYPWFGDPAEARRFLAAEAE